MTTVLVTLDGSELAERALPYAIELARATRGRLLLVRAALAYSYERDGVAVLAPLHPAVRVELEGVADRVRATGVTAEAHLVHGISAADTILKAVADLRPDLVVMSTHGRGGLGRFLYGSVADQVLREADVPVLLVPAASAGAWPEEGRLRVLVPLDGSDLARAALRPLMELATVLPSEVVLVRAVPSTATTVLGEPPLYVLTRRLDADPELAAARGELESEASRLGGLLPVVGTRVEVGDPAATIAAVAREEGAHLIAMSTHGRGGLTRLVMGSVAAGALHHATVPLLLVRAGARSGEEATERAVEPAVTPIAPEAAALTLGADELSLVQFGLEMLLHSAERDETLTAPVRALRDRISTAARGDRETAGAAGR
jgi:nucleotide-binding universal stress UspA family protein